MSNVANALQLLAAVAARDDEVVNLYPRRACGFDLHAAEAAQRAAVAADEQEVAQLKTALAAKEAQLRKDKKVLKSIINDGF